MTTKLIIQNDSTSNGDVVVRYAHTCGITGGGDGAFSARHGSGNTLRLMPGDPPAAIGITDYSMVSITEEWPTKKPANIPVPEGSEH